MSLPRTRLGSAARLATLTACTLLFVLAAAAPALAHSRASIASNFDSRIVAEPDVPGTSWRVLAGGDLLEVDHRGDAELVILGYDDEPYLRFSPDGVSENRNSPATYLNQERTGDVAVPPGADPDADPRWERVSRSPRHAWHDHRVHWMAPDPPPAATEAAEPVVIQQWTVPVRVDGQLHALEGQLWWVPGSGAWRWVLLGAALTAPALAGLRRPVADVPARARPAAAVVAVVALANGFLIVDELTWPAPLLDQLFGALHQFLFVGAALAGAAHVWRSRQSTYLVLGIASGALLFHQGLLPVRLLWASELPTLWPPGLLRGLVAASLMQAVWVAVVIGVGLARRDAAPPSDRRTEPAHAPSEIAR